MPNYSLILDKVFSALSNPTRRQVIEQLGVGPLTVTELARPFSMALPSFSQHLDVLEGAELVSSTKIGRVRTYRLEPLALLEAEHWMETHRRQWESRLDQLDRFLTSQKESYHE